jgi:alkanesulfonate monooxygenase SsuD/methylene tetrahydromethanopterin reductase-like flavin-dependent oxidoreductase (luciferase family)
MPIRGDRSMGMRRLGLLAHNASLEPKPTRILDLVGRKADGWLPTLHYVAHVLGREPEQLYALRRHVRQAATAAGRDPETITYAVNVAVLIREQGARRPGQIVGGTQEVIAQLRVLLDHGFTFINFWSSGDVSRQGESRQGESRQGESRQWEQLAQDIIPALRRSGTGA